MRRPRALSALLVVVLIGLVVATLSAPAREQLKLSTRRAPEHFVELSFTDPDQARSCRQPRPGRSTVGLSLHSQLAERSDVPFTVTVHRPAATVPKGSTPPAPTRGRFRTVPDQTTTTRVAIAVPRTRAYRLEVRLPGRSEFLSVRCVPQGSSS